MATDWKTLTPILQAEHAAGAGVKELAERYGLNKGSISRALKKTATGATKATVAELQGATQGAQGDNATAQDGEGSSKLSPSTPSWLEREREKAREMMGKTLSGEFDPSAQQAAMIKLALKDELEPETERNLYVGQPTDELAERALVLAVSVLGLVKVAAQLRSLAKAGTLDLGLNWTPEDGDGATAHGEDTARAVEADGKNSVADALADGVAPKAAEVVAPAVKVSADLGGV